VRSASGAAPRQHHAGRVAGCQGRQGIGAFTAALVAAAINDQNEACRPTLRSIAVMGFWNGAIVVLNAAAPPAWLSRPAGSDWFRAAVAFYPECLMQMAQDQPPRIPPLILIGDADDWTLASSCRRMADQYADKGSPLKLVVLPGARHSFDDPNLPPRSLPDVMNINSRSGTGATVGRNSRAATESEGLVAQFLRSWPRPRRDSVLGMPPSGSVDIKRVRLLRCRSARASCQCPV